MTLLRAASALTHPLLPDDFLTLIEPLWSTREPRGRVTAVLPETKDAATIWLQTSPGWPEHLPGQYVRVGVDIDGRRHWRTYSLTGARNGRIAITVKAIPDGFVSQELAHRTEPGTIVRLAPPTGDFVLPAERPRRMQFVTAGSGITPVMAMLRALEADGDLDGIDHSHIAPSRADVIFGEELRRLAKREDGYTLREHHDDAHGLFDVTRLDPSVPTWACGPAGLLDALEAHVDELHLERFRPVLAAAGAEGEGGTVTFLKSGVTATPDGATPILTAGEEAGALLPSGCRMGICHTCVGALRSGAVRDLRTGETHDTEGELVRTCVSAPCGPVELDL